MSKDVSNSLKIQERDLSLLRGMFESRVLTAAHASVLYFGGKKEATKKRLQKLKAAGLISERRRRLYEPTILSLSKKALSVLREHGVLGEYPQLGLGSLDKRTRV
ncbi:MAG: hypothetical protein MN733_17410, partial [Nitrososphaera sp.]|nr:hypothetical protein [Nitrososphaera sp.]